MNLNLVAIHKLATHHFHKEKKMSRGGAMEHRSSGLRASECLRRRSTWHVACSDISIRQMAPETWICGHYYALWGGEWFLSIPTVSRRTRRRSSEHPARSETKKRLKAGLKFAGGRCAMVRNTLMSRAEDVADQVSDGGPLVHKRQQTLKKKTFRKGIKRTDSEPFAWSVRPYGTRVKVSGNERVPALVVHTKLFFHLFTL